MNNIKPYEGSLILPYKKLFSNQHLTTYEKSSNQALFENDDDFRTHFHPPLKLNGRIFLLNFFFTLKILEFCLSSQLGSKIGTHIITW